MMSDIQIALLNVIYANLNIEKSQQHVNVLSIYCPPQKKPDSTIAFKARDNHYHPEIKTGESYGGTGQCFGYISL